MEFNHKFSNISSYSHKFGFDRCALEYQQHNTLVSLPTSEDTSKDNTKSNRRKKSSSSPTQK